MNKKKEDIFNVYKLEDTYPGIPHTSISEAFRNTDHTKVTAFNDLIDNSLDASATNVNIEFETLGTDISKVRIVDNGDGFLSKETLVEGLRLGSKSDKIKTQDLGIYGIGLNAACLTLGRKITVKTKNKNGDYLIGIYDHDEISKGQWNIFVREGSREEYIEFKNSLNKPTGTIVEIAKIDRVFESATQLRNQLIKSIAMTYFYVLSSGIKIIVHGKEVKPFDPLYRANKNSQAWLKNKEVEYNGSKFKISFNWLHENIKDDMAGKGGENRDATSAGLYIYRNYRLVGRALDLSVIPTFGDNYQVGSRAELHFSGEDDNLFNSSITKNIHEGIKHSMDTGFLGFLQKEFQEYTRRAKIEQGELASQRKKAKKETIVTFKSFDNAINRNVLWKKHFKPVETTLVDSLPTGEHFRLKMEDSKFNIEINMTHPFWTEYLYKQSKEVTKIQLWQFACIGAGLATITDVDLKELDNRDELLNQVYETMGREMRNLLKSF